MTWEQKQVAVVIKSAVGHTYLRVCGISAFSYKCRGFSVLYTVLFPVKR